MSLNESNSVNLKASYSSPIRPLGKSSESRTRFCLSHETGPTVRWTERKKKRIKRAFALVMKPVQPSVEPKEKKNA